MRMLTSCVRPGRPGPAILPLLALLATVALPAGAELVIFDLDTGNLNSGSGVALGGNSVIGLYPEGAAIPVEVTFDDPSSATLDFDMSGVGIPDAIESLGDSRFEFTILASSFSLTLDAVTGEINPFLDDPQVLVQIDKFDPGGFVPIATTTAMMDLSTVMMEVPGGCSGPARMGLPIEPITGQVTLRGLGCVAQLGSSTSLILDLKLTGTLPVPEASAMLLGSGALATLGALARAGRANRAGA